MVESLTDAESVKGLGETSDFLNLVRETAGGQTEDVCEAVTLTVLNSVLTDTRDAAGPCGENTDTVSSGEGKTFLTAFLLISHHSLFITISHESVLLPSFSWFTPLMHASLSSPSCFLMPGIEEG